MMDAVYSSVPQALIDAPAVPLRESIDHEALGRLADSIAAEGLHQPVGVCGPSPAGRYRLAWGHRRLLAVRLLGRETISARVLPWDTQERLAMVSENLQREDLTPMDEARAVQEFLNAGQPASAVARLFRRSEQWVHERLDLLALPADCQAAVAARTLALGVVRAIADVDHDDYRRSLLREAERAGCSTNQALVWVQHFKADRDRLVSNMLTIDQMAREREAWKILVPCELCREDYEYHKTRSLRVCDECLGAMLQLVDRAAREATA